MRFGSCLHDLGEKQWDLVGRPSKAAAGLQAGFRSRAWTPGSGLETRPTSVLLGFAVLLLALPLLAQEPQRMVYEGVIHDRGKTIGSTILMEIAGEKVTGWIQKHDYMPIENGSVTSSGFTFTAGGNTYKIDTKASRISYGGPDGSGDQRLVKMEPVRGRVYRLTEEADYERTMTLQMPDGDHDFVVSRPAVWKRAGPPIHQFDPERLDEILGKTVTFWRIRTGGAYTIEVIEEPEGMEMLAKIPKEKKDKKGKKK